MRADRTRAWGLASTLALVAVTTAACGTTVPSSQIAQAQAGTSGLTADGTTPLPGGGVSPGGPVASPGSGPAEVTPGGGSGTTSGSGAAGSSGASLPPVNGGKALGPIKVGVLTATGAGKYQQSLGFSHGATGDQVAMTQSVVRYINAHGGLGGRKIDLVSYDVKPADEATNQSAALQAACPYFTQDHPVTAVASYLALLPDNFYECMAKAHVPLVTPDEGASRDFFRRYASAVYMPSGPSYSRLLADSVEVLWNNGWLKAGSTVGVVGYDTVDVHAIVDKGLVPALQRHGLKLAAGLYTSTTTAAASEYNGGVLSFETKHVDRVFFAPGGQPIYFILAAKQQAYHPLYELGSLEYPTLLAANNMPPDQLAGSMGLAWLPYLDLPSDQWSSVTTPAIAECRKALASAQQDLASGTTLGIGAWICDDWMFLRGAFAKGASPDEAGIRRAVESLGGTFRPASTFSTAFGPTRTHDGASGYRLIAYQEACNCYRYTSPVRTLR